MKSMDTRVTETEMSCQFSAAESESNKKELKAAKEEIKNLKKSSATTLKLQQNLYRSNVMSLTCTRKIDETKSSFLRNRSGWGEGGLW